MDFFFKPKLVIYLVLRRMSDSTRLLVLMAAAAFMPLAVGFAVPWWANEVTERRAAALIAQDHGAPPILPAGLSVTYAVDRSLGSPGECSDICQRLLFTRTAKSFIEVPLDLLTAQTSLPIPARRFSLGPIGPGCNNARLRWVYATDAESGREARPPPLWNKLAYLAKGGLCLHDDAVRDVRSDVLVVERWNYDPAFRTFDFGGNSWRLSLHPIAPFKRREVFRHTPSGSVRLMRRTEVEYARLVQPLWLSPGFNFDTASPTHWAWRDQCVIGSPIDRFQQTRWNGVIANDLAVHGLR